MASSTPTGELDGGVLDVIAGTRTRSERVVTMLDRSVCLALGSGQVVTSLASAAKELVENALDAGSRSVELRLRGWGAEGMEVVDDGEGIAKESHHLLCRRNTTSKLSKMEDLEICATYGFRGEALSSLAAVAGGLSIVTRTKHDEVGSVLEYNRTGELVSTDSVARAVGTTVSLKEIFKDMPVRRKDLMRNVKREYGRVLGVMQSLSLIKNDVRIVIRSSAAATKPLNTAFATQGGSLRDNYACIFGSSSVGNLEDIDIGLRKCDVQLSGLISRAAPGCGRSAGDRQYIYVNGRPVDLPRAARCVNDVYRQYNSLQYPVFAIDIDIDSSRYDINVTPDKTKILIHDEAGFIDALREGLEMHYDVHYRDITPLEFANEGPKRLGKKRKLASDPAEQTLSEEEEEEEESDDSDRDKEFARSDEEHSESQDEHAMDTSGGEVECAAVEGTITAGEAHTTSRGKSIVNINSLDAFANDIGGTTQAGPSAFNGYRGSVRAAVDKFRGRSRLPVDGPAGGLKKKVHRTNVADDGGGTRNFAGNVPKIDKFFKPDRSQDCCDKAPSSPVVVNGEEGARDGGDERRSLENDGDDNGSAGISGRREDAGDVQGTLGVGPAAGEAGRGFIGPPARHESPAAVDVAVELFCRGGEPYSPSGGAPTSARTDLVSPPPSTVHNAVELTLNGQTEDGEAVAVDTGNGADDVVDLTAAERCNRGEDAVETEAARRNEGQELDVCLEDVVRRMRRLKNKTSAASTPGSRAESVEGFVSAASMANLAGGTSADADADPDQKETSLRAAEVELESKFQKSDFALLRVVGQFNLGFIICCLRNNVFIIDQHAADEKANYERLEANTILKRQPLIVPAPLDVSASDEVMLLENRELFRKNGFDFFEDHAGRVGRRVLLKAVPYSKGIVFGPDDVRELLAQLQGIGEGHVDSRTVVPRPSRVRTMLASRACRYSIMIGRHLDLKQMKKVVFNLSTLRSPWNCPHGRPTMRHLVSLGALNGPDGHACVGVEL